MCLYHQSIGLPTQQNLKKDGSCQVLHTHHHMGGSGTSIYREKMSLISPGGSTVQEQLNGPVHIYTLNQCRSSLLDKVWKEWCSGGQTSLLYTHKNGNGCVLHQQSPNTRLAEACVHNIVCVTCIVRPRTKNRYMYGHTCTYTLYINTMKGH